MNNYIIYDDCCIDLDDTTSFSKLDRSELLAILNRKIRFGGQYSKANSVLSHTYMCMTQCHTDRMRDLMFMHDMHEAIIGDIVTPVKRLLVNKDKIEPIDNALYNLFGVEKPDAIERMTIRSIDYTSYMYEVFLLGGYEMVDWYFKADYNCRAISEELMRIKLMAIKESILRFKDNVTFFNIAKSIKYSENRFKLKSPALLNLNIDIH